jgi:hypothetical protein
VAGLCLALSDWSAELRILQSGNRRVSGISEMSPPMIRVRRRVEKLEQAFAPLDAQAEPQVILVEYVNAQREVVDSYSVEVPRPAPGWAGRRRTAPSAGVSAARVEATRC